MDGREWARITVHYGRKRRPLANWSGHPSIVRSREAAAYRSRYVAPAAMSAITVMGLIAAGATYALL